MRIYTRTPAVWILLLGSFAPACSAPNESCPSCVDTDVGDVESDAMSDAVTSDAADDGASPGDVPDPESPDATDATQLDVALDAATPDTADGDAADAGDTSAELDTAELDDITVEVSDSGDLPRAAWVAVGTGYVRDAPNAGYRPIVPGEALIMTEGPQGGVHVWGGFEGAGLPMRVRDAVFTLTAADGTEIGSSIITADLLPYGEHYASASHPVFIALEYVWEELEGPAYDLCVFIDLPDGSTLTDCASVTTECCLYLE